MGYKTILHLVTHACRRKITWTISSPNARTLKKFGCFEALHINILPPTQTESFTEWWLGKRRNFADRIKHGFDSYMIATAWSLWKQRNARVFHRLHEHRSPPQLADQVLLEVKD